MNKFPSKETVERLRKQYPSGTRVELVCMNDPYSKLKPGDKGTVEFVDDTGTIFCSWDTGSKLGVVYDADTVRNYSPKRENSTMTESIKGQILAIRDSGVTNMFDFSRVQYEANERGFNELVVFLINHRDEYGRFILTGEFEK